VILDRLVWAGPSCGTLVVRGMAGIVG
jgi:hypothetical protein